MGHVKIKNNIPVLRINGFMHRHTSYYPLKTFRIKTNSIHDY